VMADGFSTADFRHGPIAVCGPRRPPAPRTLRPGRPGRSAARAGQPGCHEPADRHRTGRRAGWPVLGHAGECLLATVRGQQLALARCQALGIDPDQPAGLSKVTLTH
jgi:glucosamine--fructose-6-phosphate aminotransferase (isomerizing)